MRKRLTRAVCEAAKYAGRSYPGRDGKPVHSRHVIWDAGSGSVPGFGLRVAPSGDRAFIVRYVVAGRVRIMVLGRYAEGLTVAAAREKAARVRALARDGKDPLAERQEARQAPTVADVADAFLKDARRRCKASTIHFYGWLLNRAIVPRLGTRRLVSLTRRDVRELHRSLSDRPVVANRAVAVLATLCNYAIGEEIIAANPAKGVLDKKTKNPEKPRQRFLDENGIAHLQKAPSSSRSGSFSAPGLRGLARAMLPRGGRGILRCRSRICNSGCRCLELPGNGRLCSSTPAETLMVYCSAGGAGKRRSCRW